MEQNRALVQQGRQYQGKLLCPYAYGVVFTNITRKQFDSQPVLAEVLQSNMVICKDEMTESVDAGDFQERLWAMSLYDFGITLTEQQIDRIRWHLYPEMRLNDSHNDVLEAFTDYLEDDKTQGVISSVEAVGDMSKWFMTQIDELKTENQRLRKQVGHAQARIERGDETATATPRPVAEGEVRADAKTEPKKRKYGKRLEKRLAIAMVHRTVDSIMQWNNTKGREHKDKWYVSGPAIQDVIRDADFSISQSRVKTVLDERREEIELHHVEHDLGLRHNAKGDKGITSDIYIEFNEGA